MRWSGVHTAAVSWVGRMTNLVECWNLLDGRVVELSTWVSATDSEASAGLSIEKLESQLQILKENFAEKEEMLKTLKDNCGPNASYDKNYPTLLREESKIEPTIQVIYYSRQKCILILILNFSNSIRIPRQLQRIQMLSQKLF